MGLTGYRDFAPPDLQTNPTDLRHLLAEDPEDLEGVVMPSVQKIFIFSKRFLREVEEQLNYFRKHSFRICLK